MYSQNDEERVILEVFEGKTDGRFLDLGAYDAKMLSNTRALYERGWSGVMVEPSPECFAALLNEYANDPRITLVNAIAGFKFELVPFYSTADALSTALQGQRETMERHGYKFRTHLSVSVPIGELMLRFGLFDFVSIDTEGMSVALLAEVARLCPTLISVEHEGQWLEIERRYSETYEAIHRTGENLILRRK